MADYNKIIDELTDEELKIFLKHINISRLLKPLIADRKKYAQQIKRLGRLDSKSAVIKALLPGTVCSQIRKGDLKYIEILTSEFDDKRKEILKIIEECVESNPISPNVPESYAAIYRAYANTQNEACEEEYFWILLKLMGEEVEPALKERVQYCIKRIRENEEASAEYEGKVEALKQEYSKEIEQLKKAHLKEIKDLSKEIQTLRKTIQEKREELERSWESDTASKHEAAIKALDNEYKLKSKQLTEEYQKKKDELNSGLEEKSRELFAKYEELETNIKTKHSEYTSEIDKLNQQRSALAEDVDVLSKRREQLQAYIDDYFEKFEGHVMQRNIDHLLEGRLAESAFTVSESMNNRPEAAVAGCDSSHIFVYGGEEIEGGEKGEKPADMEDVLLDLSDNLSIFFEQSSEIAKLILTIFNNKKILMVDSASAVKLGDSISALVDAKAVTVLDCNDGKYSLEKISHVIDSIQGSVILLDGILDRFDDKVFGGIYATKKDKLVLVSYPDLECLNVISKKYLQYAIPLYLDGCLKFVDDSNYVIGEYDLLEYVPKLTKKGMKSCYEKNFWTFCRCGYITQNMALELTKFYYTYRELTKDGKTSDLMKESIRQIIGYTEDNEDRENLLKVIDLL